MTVALITVTRTGNTGAVGTVALLRATVRRCRRVTTRRFRYSQLRSGRRKQDIYGTDLRRRLVEGNESLTLTLSNPRAVSP